MKGSTNEPFLVLSVILVPVLAPPCLAPSSQSRHLLPLSIQAQSEGSTFLMGCPASRHHTPGARYSFCLACVLHCGSKASSPPTLNTSPGKLSLSTQMSIESGCALSGEVLWVLLAGSLQDQELLQGREKILFHLDPPNMAQHDVNQCLPNDSGIFWGNFQHQSCGQRPFPINIFYVSLLRRLCRIFFF